MCTLLLWCWRKSICFFCCNFPWIKYCDCLKEFFFLIINHNDFVHFLFYYYYDYNKDRLLYLILSMLDMFLTAPSLLFLIVIITNKTNHITLNTCINKKMIHKNFWLNSYVSNNFLHLPVLPYILFNLLFYVCEVNKGKYNKTTKKQDKLEQGFI